jgi:proline iminopeptidase
MASEDRLAADRENKRAFPDEELSKLSDDQAFVRGYIRNAARTWFNPRFDCTPLWQDVTVNMDMFGYVWGKVFSDIDVTDGLQTLDRPVFLALGRYDFIVAPPSSWDPIKASFQNLTIQIFERSGHTPQFEESELFDERTLSWMNESSAAAGTI